MLFARAPFDDPMATNDKARRDATMQQILRGEWTAPASIPVAPECMDLLRGILNSDPNARLSLQQIMSHPWFSVGLPPAALTMNTVLVRQQTAQPPPYEQTVEEVNEVLEEATRRVGAGRGGLVGCLGWLQEWNQCTCYGSCGGKALCLGYMGSTDSAALHGHSLLGNQGVCVCVLPCAQPVWAVARGHLAYAC